MHGRQLKINVSDEMQSSGVPDLFADVTGKARVGATGFFMFAQIAKSAPVVIRPVQTESVSVSLKKDTILSE